MTQDRKSGIAIIVGAIALVVTMVLHPTGGDLAYIVSIAPVVVGTHSLAIASLVLVTVGFLGLTARLSAAKVLAWSAMVTVSFGSVAAMCAAVLNGLALPAFAQHHADSDPATLEVVGVILGYNHALNASFARVFMVATAVAVVLWSIAIVTTRALPRWAGFAGGVAGVSGLAVLAGGIVDVSVHDFGVFVFGYAAWAILVGLLLCRHTPSEAA